MGPVLLVWLAGSLVLAGAAYGVYKVASDPNTDLQTRLVGAASAAVNVAIWGTILYRCVPPRWWIGVVVRSWLARPEAESR